MTAHARTTTDRAAWGAAMARARYAAEHTAERLSRVLGMHYTARVVDPAPPLHVRGAAAPAAWQAHRELRATPERWPIELRATATEARTVLDADTHAEVRRALAAGEVPRLPAAAVPARVAAAVAAPVTHVDDRPEWVKTWRIGDPIPAQEATR